MAEYRDGLEIYAKRLQKHGSQAVALLNRTDKAATIEVSFKDIGIAGEAFVRDLWEHKDKGLFVNSYSTLVPAHGTSVISIDANEYLKPLPDNRIKLKDIPDQGLVFECEDKGFIWLCGKIDDKTEGYSGSGYLYGENTWWMLTAIWRVSLEQAGKFKLTFRYINRMDSDVEFALNKSSQSVLLEKGTKWKEVSVIGDLKQGINWIELISPDKNLNNISFDYMRLSKVE
ncbi:MAG: hypothetical protein HC819_03820 [Cyclobacteriaceae bacterium]|nr:hypothetical protein [Cyclobacteriaceae bacterium]